VAGSHETTSSSKQSSLEEETSHPDIQS